MDDKELKTLMQKASEAETDIEFNVLCNAIYNEFLDRRCKEMVGKCIDEVFI